MNLRNLSRVKKILLAVVLVTGVTVAAVLMSTVFKKEDRQAVMVGPAREAQVVITSAGFQPATLKVKAGTIVTWVNHDEAAHQVASDPHPAHTGLPGLDSNGDLPKGQSYSFTFSHSGTYTYHDERNPLTFMGTIQVE